MVKQLPPASVVATWPKANFVDPVTRGPELQIVCTLLVVLVIGILALRVWVRSRIIHAMGADDWLMLAALLPALALYGACMASVKVGWDRHSWDQKPKWFESSELVSWLIQLLYTPTMALAKASILVSFLRLIPFGPMRWATWGTLVIVVLWGISLTFATIFNCHPVDGYWKATNTDHCIDEGDRLLVISIINVLTDIVVIVIPMGAFWRLKIQRRQKIILYILLNIGLVATVASVVRTIFLVKAEVEFDITWNGYVIWIMTMVECSLALICPSVPSLRPLAKKFLSSTWRSTNPGTSQPKITSQTAGDRHEGKFQSRRDFEDRMSDEIPLDSTVDLEMREGMPPKVPPKVTSFYESDGSLVEP